MAQLKTFLKKVLPAPIYDFLRFFPNYRHKEDLVALFSFFKDKRLNLTIKERFRIVNQMNIISSGVTSPHGQGEMLSFLRTILSLNTASTGVIVEAGCFKGSSTAKFSLAADIMGKELVVFDSFQGLPEDKEAQYKNLPDGEKRFKQGDYCGTLDEVKANVRKFGKIMSCRFVSGWFEDTMPGFKSPIFAAYIDVDLASSTRTCLKYLYPLLKTGGVLYSQDGHIQSVVDVYKDDEFWANEIGCKKPHIFGLGKNKLIKIVKEV